MYTKEGGTDQARYALNETLAFDLSDSWNLDSVEPVRSPHTGIYDPVRRPGLWHDPIHNLIYSFGGWGYNWNTSSAAYAFTPTKDGNARWLPRFEAGDGTSFSQFTIPGLSLSAQTDKAFYSLGGMLSLTVFGMAHLKNKPTVEGMAKFDFESENWSNISSTGSSDNGRYGAEGLAIAGEAEYIPIFGEEGVLIFIGGDSPTSRDWKPQTALVPMSTISIFDIRTQKWHKQEATGDVPISRGAFCSVSAGEKDSGTYEIYILGGIRNEDLAEDDYLNLGQIHVLTLPTFKWTTIPSSNAPPRESHNCQIIGGRQMLVTGGSIVTRRRLDAVQKDPWANGLGLFDLTDLKWKNRYDSEGAPYQRSQFVKGYYFSKGTEPETWSSSAVKALFKAPSNSSAPVKNEESSNSTNVGAIVGGVVGGVVAVVIIIAILFFFLRRNKKYQNIPRLPEAPDSQAPSTMGGNSRYESAAGVHHQGAATGGSFTSIASGHMTGISSSVTANMARTPATVPGSTVSNTALSGTTDNRESPTHELEQPNSVPVFEMCAAEPIPSRNLKPVELNGQGCQRAELRA
ncbi:hypothetical protein AJ79_07071 [Helicocarpus griseus UAMH5409]|uniref:Kelch repeat protein n=1 Tax=Helicocarpus griseus UAMH5409 TaxID=1447875 RepID=A0A2B7X6G6_9EURO|nr:hypothetical protein AJ79_07071 [Helicocarpus griseus UAMH5409]